MLFIFCDTIISIYLTRFLKKSFTTVNIIFLYMHVLVMNLANYFINLS